MSGTDAWHMLVAAFDFGTTYSGYAYSYRDIPSFVQANQPWTDGAGNITTVKTPTCVLLTPGREFHSFGYEAEDMYRNLAKEDKHHGWLFFRRFKMLLHNCETLTRETTVEDINGVSMPAITIFTMAIKYLKEQLLQSLDLSSGFVKETDIQYILTVPAIWDEKARMFMKEAAVEAGLSDRRLRLCREPDAAAIYCQSVKSLFPSPDQPEKEVPYMVIDLGGGTADIYVHEKKEDNTIKELYRASGGPWGGALVDNAYLEFITTIFGTNIMLTFKEQHMVDFFDLIKDFEAIKRTISPETSGMIQFAMPPALMEVLKEAGVNEITIQISQLNPRDFVTFNNSTIDIDASVVKRWFSVPMNNVIEHVLSVLEMPEMQRVENILLVGGFGENKLVQDELKKGIGKTIVIPEDPVLTVLKGAVRFGQLPEIVSSRPVHTRQGIGQQ